MFWDRTNEKYNSGLLYSRMDCWDFWVFISLTPTPHHKYKCIQTQTLWHHYPFGIRVTWYHQYPTCSYLYYQSNTILPMTSINVSLAASPAAPPVLPGPTILGPATPAPLPNIPLIAQNLKIKLPMYEVFWILLTCLWWLSTYKMSAFISLLTLLSR